MIQVFDTHCMGYRNAKLRAFALADNTRRLDFYNFANINISDADNCGNEIETDEAGYLFYGGGQHRILCLGLQEAAIIEVSLDGGTTWQIQWIIHEPASNGNSTEPATLSWRNANGVIETYSPNGNNKELPEFLLKRDYQSGKWAEEELILAANDTIIQVPPWTKTILISQAAPDVIALTARPRSGQVIIINACRNTRLIYDDGVDPARLVGNIERQHTYLLFNFAATGGYNNGYPMLIDAAAPTANLVPVQYRDISPDWTQLSNYEWATTTIYDLPQASAIIINFDYLQLPGTGWTTGQTNTLRIKVRGAAVDCCQTPIIIKPTAAMPAASSTALRLRVEVCDAAGDTIAVVNGTSISYTSASSGRRYYELKPLGSEQWALLNSASVTYNM